MKGNLEIKGHTLALLKGDVVNNCEKVKVFSMPLTSTEFLKPVNKFQCTVHLCKPIKSPISLSLSLSHKIQVNINVYYVVFNIRAYDSLATLNFKVISLKYSKINYVTMLCSGSSGICLFIPINQPVPITYTNQFSCSSWKKLAFWR